MVRAVSVEIAIDFGALGKRTCEVVGIADKNSQGSISALTTKIRAQFPHRNPHAPILETKVVEFYPLDISDDVISYCNDELAARYDTAEPEWHPGGVG